MSRGLAEAFPAGEILADELEERGWTQAEFAEILGRPTQFVSEIIAGKKEITRESASQIAAALGTSAEFWLNLQDQYHLWRQAQDEGIQAGLTDVRRRARMNELAPIGILRQRGLVRGTTLDDQEEDLKRLLGIASLDDEPQFMAAARKTDAGAPLSHLQAAWVAVVRNAAAACQVAAYDAGALEALGAGLTRCLRQPSDFSHLPRRFAEVGVRLVYVEAFPSSKMDGCSLLHADGSPVIGISGRGKRMDKVLFTILHEAAHVVLGHLDHDEYIVDDQDDTPAGGLEGPANELAADWVLPAALPRVPERLGRDWLDSVAQTLGIHPIVLIGRLQNEGRIPWRTTLVKGAPSVTRELEAWGS